MQKAPLSKLFDWIDKAEWNPHSYILQLRYQVEQYYPKLRGVIFPVETRKPGFRHDLTPTQHGYYFTPKRWQEPLVQYFVKSYRGLMKPSDNSLRMNNDATESDPVYASIVNWDLREAIRKRTMSQKTYERAYKLITEGHATALPNPTERSLSLRSQDITRYQPRDLVARLDNLTDGLLALESGLSCQAAMRLQQKGRTGSEIVDLGFIKKERRTSSESIQRMLDQRVDDWSDLVDASRRTKCSATMLLRVMANIGTSDVNDILGIIEDAVAVVSQYAEGRRISEGRAWCTLFKIYTSVGRGDIERSVDIFNGEFLAGWDEASSSYWEAV